MITVTMRAGRVIRLLLLASLSGLFLGVTTRLAMRLVALEAGVTSGFSLAGSLEVVAFGMIVSTPVALLFCGFRSRLPLPGPWPGVLCGAGLFGVLAAVPPPAARSALSGVPDTPAATVLTFGLCFLAWGLVVEYLATFAGGPHHEAR